MAGPLRRSGNLPAEVTSFVGRRRELADLTRKLAIARLVTLVGPGGVGKTRLAVRGAARHVRAFPGGAWLVELAELRNPTLVGNAVMAALDLRDQAATEPRALVLSYLRNMELLLVLDGCEHLLEATGALVLDVIRAAPGVRVIATSRESLAVPGEHVILIPPLDLPSHGADETLNQLRHNEAVMLFTERAAAASGRFELTAANQAAVVELCRRLDGLPLAIELAARRTRVLSVEQILDRLSDRFGLLARGRRAAVPRHQTLRATIDWSHDLLEPGEQALLRRLGVFAGRLTLEDVEGVCTSQEVPAADVLELLSSLVDKSLVMKEEVRGLACYRLHDTMREYAGLQLRQAGEEEVVELRLAEHYLATCARAATTVQQRMVEWLQWMELEIDNVRAVLRRCLTHDDTSRGLDLASSVSWYWINRATSEGVRWLDELLASGDGRHERHVVAHFVRGFLSVLQSDPAAARPALARAAAAARTVGQVQLLPESLAMASVAESQAGDRAAALRLLGEAQAVMADPDYFPGRISILQAQTLHAFFEGDLDAARSAASEGARLSRREGEPYTLHMMLMNLGLAALLGGDLEESKPPLDEALGIARRLDDRVVQFQVLQALGYRAASSGQPRLAAQLLGAAEAIRAGVGANVMEFLVPMLAEAQGAAIAALGPSRFEAEFQAGRRLRREEALALALGEAGQAADASAGGAGPTLLGRREVEVARLVADGLSNKQIGARLFISERTVDSHVRNILNKLGFNNRAQIASWITSDQ
jgi:predicted ATPase/DNA-binding CsgD family transcriptional regulator